MPNIEIHGVRFGMESETNYSNLNARIAELLRGAHFEKDVVVTDYASSVIDLKGSDQPYLRLVAPRESDVELEDIEQRLKPLKIDIEVLYLERFTPKDDPLR